MMNRLAGKVAIVTGGAGRIGAASAKRFAQEGAQVVIADFADKAAQKVADEIGPAAIAIAYDAGAPDTINAMVQRVAEYHGRIDILQNGAALLDMNFLADDRTAVDTEIDIWDRTMQVNVRGYMVTCKHVIPHMRASGGGSIINIASNGALAGDRGRIAYGTSKGAILTMTKYLATQHGRDGIRCNSILPGLILDPALETQVAELARMTRRHCLIDRNGRPEDVAALAAFFASDDAAFITGQSINCDGGLLAHLPFYADQEDLPAALH